MRRPAFSSVTPERSGLTVWPPLSRRAGRSRSVDLVFDSWYLVKFGMSQGKVCCQEEY